MLAPRLTPPLPGVSQYCRTRARRRGHGAWSHPEPCRGTAPRWRAPGSIGSQSDICSRICSRSSRSTLGKCQRGVEAQDRHTKKCRWPDGLVRHGAIRGNFVPDRSRREPRELTRARNSSVQERSAGVNRLQQTLEGRRQQLGSRLLVASCHHPSAAHGEKLRHH